MTGRKNDPASSEDAVTQAAKGAARETIGKLIGDDAEVSTGRAEQEAAADRRPPPKPGL